MSDWKERPRLVTGSLSGFEALVEAWTSLAEGYRRQADEHDNTDGTEAQRLRAAAITLESCANSVQGHVDAMVQQTARWREVVGS